MMTENIDHRRWSERCLLTRGDHIKKINVKQEIHKSVKIFRCNRFLIYFRKTDIQKLKKKFQVFLLAFSLGLWWFKNETLTPMKQIFQPSYPSTYRAEPSQHTSLKSTSQTDILNLLTIYQEPLKTYGLICTSEALWRLKMFI